ncbi:class I SAM-dependent methyltransferase [Chitinispirillales bacterium ANBcel5]|uniref:class I SAM-dependent methyltransferase n=1 Tax=Cellulosispirillum alkaliphilum TaxID=3039283 RepID=UPI002A567E69|nr:class I SAM-dependent methyltransferase [Chitinispirillales bacterium ANBcel5]
MSKDRQNKEKNFWDNYAKKYDSLIQKIKPTYNLLIGYILEYIDSSKDVLEIASGTGIITLEIAEKANKVYGCDISPEMVNVANEKLNKTKIKNIKFEVQDAYELDYMEESFDIVIASNVLHIMINPERALSSVYKVLKPNGILIAPTYCHGENLITRFISSLMSIVGFKAYQKWSISEFENFTESNKYKIIEFKIIKGKIPLAFVVTKKI